MRTIRPSLDAAWRLAFFAVVLVPFLAALPDAALAQGGGACNPSTSCTVSAANPAIFVGDTVRVECTLGAEDITGGTLNQMTIPSNLADPAFQYALDCADFPFGGGFGDCTDDGAVISFQGGVSTTCPVADVDTNVAGNVVEFTFLDGGNNPTSITLGANSTCALAWDVQVDSLGNDSFPANIQSVALFNGECDQPQPLQAAGQPTVAINVAHCPLDLDKCVAVDTNGDGLDPGDPCFNVDTPGGPPGIGAVGQDVEWRVKIRSGQGATNVAGDCSLDDPTVAFPGAGGPFEVPLSLDPPFGNPIFVEFGAAGVCTDPDTINTATVTCNTCGGRDLLAPETDDDTAQLLCADILIEKSTEGVDADDPDAGDAPEIMPGDAVNWTYDVTNTGGANLVDVLVTDDQGVPVTCPGGNPIPNLAPGASLTCTANGVADDVLNTIFTTVDGMCGARPDTLYANVGEAAGTAPDSAGALPDAMVSDTDPSHYCNPRPSVDIEKATNGVDADSAAAGDAPEVPIGGPITWTYVVTNNGSLDLTQVAVTDDQGVVPICPGGNPIPSLPVGASVECQANGVADDLTNTAFTVVTGVCGAGNAVPLYENIATASGLPPTGGPVMDTDPSHYCNPHPPVVPITAPAAGLILLGLGLAAVVAEGRRRRG